MHDGRQYIADVASGVLAGHPLSRDDAMRLAEVHGPELYDLFYWANRIRLRFLGPAVQCCSIVAAKVGRCPEDCRFCSQSAHYQTHVQGVTFVDNDAIVAAARQAAGQGAGAFGLVSSGLGPTDTEIERFAASIEAISGGLDITLCASLGVLTEPQARRLHALGVRMYNHNLQTSRRFFPNIVTTHDYQRRVETIRTLKKVGIRVCCGGLFGMGETWPDRIDLALELRELGVDAVPVNFLIPIPGTPLEGQIDLTPMECLKIISLYRFILPDKTIKVAGGREVHLRDLQSWMFFAGANGFLIGNYLTTCGRPGEQDRRMLADLDVPLQTGGRPIDQTRTLQDPIARYVPDKV